MNSFDDEFGKYTDFGAQAEKTPEKDKQEHTPKQDVIEMDIEKEWLKAQQLEAAERSKKVISMFTNYLHNQEKTEATPEFQEQLAKMKACFSPEVEKLFTGYLVMRGMISEKQAQDYLNRLFPPKQKEEEEEKKVEEE